MSFMPTRRITHKGIEPPLWPSQKVNHPSTPRSCKRIEPSPVETKCACANLNRTKIIKMSGRAAFAVAIILYYARMLLLAWLNSLVCHEGHSKLTSKAANLSKWGALLAPNKLFCHAIDRSIEANRGRGQFLRENKVLATPLENNDQSAFIAGPNISSEWEGGGGGSTIPTVWSIVTKFGKTQVGKTAMQCM